MQESSATALARATDGADERPRLALAPAPVPRRPLVTRRRVLGALVILIALAANAFVGRDLVATRHAQRALATAASNADQRAAQQRAGLTHLRVDLAQVMRRIKQSAESRSRANVATKHADTKAQTSRTRATSAIATADADRARTELLHACLTVLHSAMNALAVDDRTSGANELRMLEAECTAPSP